MKRERETVHQRGRLVYQLEETPPMGRRLLYAMQFVIIFIGSIVLVPMLAADDLGWGPEQVTFLLQCAIFTGGIATFVQAKGLGPVGARLPILLGTTFVVITPLVAITTEYIKLQDAMKLANAAETGGEAKLLIQEGQILVNGEICRMRGKKLRPGDRFVCGSQTYQICTHESE